MENTNGRKAVASRARFFLAHTPELVRYGSKPIREIRKKPELDLRISRQLRTWEQALAYPPNQVFIGNRSPDDLHALASPWYNAVDGQAPVTGPHGEMMPQDLFYGLVKINDDFNLVLLEQSFLGRIYDRLKCHHLIFPGDLKKLEAGVPLAGIEAKIRDARALPLYDHGTLVGCVLPGHDEDSMLTPEVILENLCCKASGVAAMRLLTGSDSYRAADVQYVFGCGEEAVGDRYNRGGGNMGKTIAERAGCVNAGGSDIKSFCCAGVHALGIGAAVVSSGLFDRVVVVGGCSFPKIGMKFQGHLAKNVPILEDTLVGAAIALEPDDGQSPVVRLDSVAKHETGTGESQPAVMQHIVYKPLAKLGLRMSEVDKYATELHNPEITLPAGSGNVPDTNYKVIAAIAAQHGEIGRADIPAFAKEHGMPGFSPTQGHIASALPYVGHAIDGLTTGKMQRVMLLAKGSLFLGKMTQMVDGFSVLLERNGPPKTEL